jgi:hypothetical protein
LPACDRDRADSPFPLIGGRSVSFAKFLELLIYSDELFPDSIEVRPVDAYAFSPVTTGTPTPLLRHYRVGSVIITFSVSTFDVYDVRLGKLTVGPAKAPRVSQSDDIASRCEESLAVSELRLQATAYFGALGKRLSLLVRSPLSCLDTLRRC